MRETRQIADAVGRPDRDRDDFPQHTLRILGEPVWAGPQGRCAIQSRKGLALLCYLASQPETEVSRRQLGALLWGDFHRGQAASNLATTLSRLKRQAPRWPIREHGEYLWWDPDLGVDTDVRLFTRRASGGSDPADLAALIRGPFMAGLDLDDAPQYSAWLAEERRRWQRRSLDVLWAAAGAARARADWSAVLDVGRRALALDALAERFVRVTMLAHASLGDRAACQEIYDQLVDRLSRQLSAVPEPDTTRLLESLLRGDLVVDARPQVVVASRAEFRTTLPPVDRRSLSRRIMDHAAGLGSEAVLTVVGRFGVGKSWLVHQALANTHALWADAAGPGARDPSFPWSQWAPSTTRIGGAATRDIAAHVAALTAASPVDGRPLVLVLDHAERMPDTARFRLLSDLGGWNPDHVRVVVVTDDPPSPAKGVDVDEFGRPVVEVPPFAPGEVSHLLKVWSPRPQALSGSARGQPHAARIHDPGDPSRVAQLMADTAGVALLMEAELGGQAARAAARRRAAERVGAWPRLVRRVFEAAASSGAVAAKQLWEGGPVLQHRMLEAVDRAVATGWLEVQDRDGETWLVWWAPVFGALIAEAMSPARAEYWRAWRQREFDRHRPGSPDWH